MNVPAGGTYGAKLPGGPVIRRILATLVRMNVGLYRRSGGTDRITRMWDFPVVLLTTKGARSGSARTAALGGFPDGDNAWLVMAVGLTAAAHQPAWFISMVNNPDDLWLEVGKRRLKVRAQSLTGTEREEAIRRMAAISPGYGRYQQQTDREIPVVRLTGVS